MWLYNALNHSCLLVTFLHFLTLSLPIYVVSFRSCLFRLGPGDCVVFPKFSYNLSVSVIINLNKLSAILLLPNLIASRPLYYNEVGSPALCLRSPCSSSFLVLFIIVSYLSFLCWGNMMYTHAAPHIVQGTLLPSTCPSLLVCIL